jgi:hypothetical protein
MPKAAIDIAANQLNFLFPRHIAISPFARPSGHVLTRPK